MRDLQSHGGPEDEILVQISIAEKCQFGIVELGVLFGETSAKFCKANPNVPVYGIDPIIPDSMNSDLIGSTERIRENTGHFLNYHFIQNYSFEVIKTFIHQFDYLFIDASHEYGHVKKDFEDWFSNLLPGGLVSLHDSAANRGGPAHWIGPSGLADELLRDPRLEYLETVYSLTIFRKL